MRGKKDEALSIELILMIVSIIGGFFLLFGLFIPKSDIQTQGFLVKMFEDGNISSEEYNILAGLTCSDMKHMLGTDKEVCIYFKDMDGNVIDIPKDGSYGFGCPGLEIHGQKICNK